MNAIAGTYGIERGSVLAIAAGADAICVGGGLADEATVLRLRDALVAAVREGHCPRSASPTPPPASAHSPHGPAEPGRTRSRRGAARPASG